MGEYCYDLPVPSVLAKLLHVRRISISRTPLEDCGIHTLFIFRSSVIPRLTLKFSSAASSPLHLPFQISAKGEMRCTKSPPFTAPSTLYQWGSTRPHNPRSPTMALPLYSGSGSPIKQEGKINGFRWSSHLNGAGVETRYGIRGGSESPVPECV